LFALWEIPKRGGSILYKAGTATELEELNLGDRIPEEVNREALRIVTMLDEIFGSDRDVNFDDGGLVFIAESKEDLVYFDQNCVALESPSLEYVELVPSGREPYLNAFFLVNEYEYGMTLLLPMSLAPERFLREISEPVEKI
jgi:hypothetical protein